MQLMRFGYVVAYAYEDNQQIIKHDLKKLQERVMASDIDLQDVFGAKIGANITWPDAHLKSVMNYVAK